MGEFGFIYDKRQPWETDTHLPLLMSGPGIKANSTVDALVTMPDLSATVLTIAGVAVPSYFDGESVLALAQATATPTRLAMLVEYHGEAGDGGSGPECALTVGTNLFCNSDGNYSVPPYFYGERVCVCQDSPNSTYACLRVRSADDSTSYRFCAFTDATSTIEWFDFVTDPYELTNLAPSMPPTVQAALEKRLGEAHACKGTAACNAILSEPIITAAGEPVESFLPETRRRRLETLALAQAGVAAAAA